MTSLNVNTILYSSDEDLLGILSDSSEEDFEVNELMVRQVCSDEDDIGSSDFEELCFKVRQHTLTRDFSSNDRKSGQKASSEGPPDVIQTVSRPFEGRLRSFETFGSIISETHLPIHWETPHTGSPRTTKNSASLRAVVVGNPHVGNDVSLCPRTTSFSPVQSLHPHLERTEGVLSPQRTNLSPVHRLNSQKKKTEVGSHPRAESFSPVHRFNSHLDDENAVSHPRTKSVCPVPVSINDGVDQPPRSLDLRSKTNIDEADGNLLSTPRMITHVPEVHFQRNNNDDEELKDAGSLQTTKIEDSQCDVESAHISGESIYDSDEEMLRSESEDSNSIYHEALVEVQNIDVQTTKPSCNNESPTMDKSSSEDNSDSNNPMKNSFFSISEILAKFSAVTDGQEGCPLESAVIDSSPFQQLPFETCVSGVVLLPESPPVPVHSPTPKACPTPSSMTNPDTVNSHTRPCRTVHSKKQKVQ